MKLAKKVLAIVLVLVTVFSLMVPAFAEEPYQYDCYFNIGDSIARGCGLDQSEDTRYYRNDKFNLTNNLDGSYPQLVRQAVVKEEKAPLNLQFMAMRTIETYYALGGDVNPRAYDNYLDSEFGWHLDGEDINKEKGVGRPENNPGCIEANRTKYQEYAAKADLITLEVGSNDVFYSTPARAGIKDLGALNMETAEKLLAAAWEGFRDFMEYFPKVVERIFELQNQGEGTSDDMTLVIVGLSNPFANCPLTDEIFLPLGEALTVITELMNAEMKRVADQYGNVFFADISAVETPISSGNLTLIDAISSENNTINTHPTKEGYKYIARQILNALPGERDGMPETFIRFNLSTDYTVDSVYLDSQKTAFCQDGYELIVPNYRTDRGTISVMGVDRDGNEVAYVYSLSYERGEGYTAKRITGSNNVLNSIVRIITGIINLIKQLLSSLGLGAK